MINEQTLVKYDNDGRICCPNCNHSALHFSEPDVVRNDDKYMVVQFKVDCEVCHTNHPFVPPFVMEISSGKGQTFVGWEYFR